MSWLIFTILGICGRAIYGVLTKVFSNRVKVSPITQSVILLVLGAILTVIVSPLIGGISFHGLSSLWPIAILMIVATALGNIVYFTAINSLEASTSQIAFSSIIIWGAILSALFLGSRFTLVQVIGMVLLLVAILLTQVKKGVQIVSKGVLWMILSAGFFAVFQVTSAVLSKTLSAGGYLLLAYLGAAAIITVVYSKKVKSELKTVGDRLALWLMISIVTMVASLLYYLFTYYAYAGAPNRGVVIVLLSSQVVLAVILAIVFLKERERLGRKLAGGVLTVIAAILIK